MAEAWGIKLVSSLTPIEMQMVMLPMWLEELITMWESDLPEICAETVYLYLGDLLIQPPGQVHSVLHLTELMHYFDVAHAGGLMNQVHNHAFEIPIQMIIGLPCSDPNPNKS
ncbi:hypothetical protein JVT61DRAFT_37 [Boletus reticuloceps]|uniref:Uncharacterized protein n=1 Tax=Boletus reticuloceps TaxID=495285 RepID=A0A8I2Z0C7_9AGAM|nr:hypothetical protein JVT61DRAFT_37 [Boletus reticuloceps]